MDNPRLVHGNVIPMGWDRHKLLWDGNGTDKYVLGQKIYLRLNRNQTAQR